MARKKILAQPDCVRAEQPLMRLVYVAAMASYPRCLRKDVVPEMQNLIGAMVSQTPGFEEFAKLNKRVGYSDVVMSIYELLTRTYIHRDDQEVIWWILCWCSNHDFNRFLKLTNVRHNPNHDSRTKAIYILHALAGSGRGSSDQLTTVGSRWKRGATYRVDQLKKAGKFPVY